MDKQELIDIITKEVMRLVSPKGNTALVLGDPDLLPSFVKDKANLCCIDCYSCEQDIQQFDKVYITQLSKTSLADIALGRSTDKTACATLSALLQGKQVYLLDTALSFRSEATKGQRALLQLYEGYVRTLISFGITLINAQKPANIYTASPAPDAALPPGVITEAVARRLIDACEGDTIRLKKGAIITPSAKDIIKEASKKIELT